MIHKGQIVEIPAASPLFRKAPSEFLSKKEELRRKSRQPEYSLFDGILVGEHQGTENFKLGQRKGINVGGKKAPLYVIGTDTVENRLFVGAGDRHPGLWISAVSMPKNGMHGFEDLIHFSEEALENGIAVAVTSPVTEDSAAAMLYVFGSEIFLEFEQPVTVAVQDYPLTVSARNNANKK